MNCYKVVAAVRSCAAPKKDDDVQLHTEIGGASGRFFLLGNRAKEERWTMYGHLRFLPLIGVFVLCFALASVCGAQTPPADQKPADPAAATPAATPAPAAPMPLGTPAITGPLSGLPPAMFDAGPLGKIAVNGILSGGGLAQSNAVPGDNSTQAAVTNGQLW